MSYTIAVFGATGIQGGSVVDALLKSNIYNVVALTRSPEGEKAKTLQKRGCQVKYADMDKPETLDTVLDGCQGVFLVTNFWEHFDPKREYNQAVNVADVANKVGIKHFVWSTLEDTRGETDTIPFIGDYKIPHFDEKGHASKYMDSIGLPVTYLYTSFYWENLIQLIKPRKGEDGIYRMVYPMGDKPLPGVTAPDIGKSVLAIFQGGQGEIGKSRGIASEAITLENMAKVLSEVSQCKVEYVDIDPDEYRNLEFQGASELGNMFQYKRDHNEVFCEKRNTSWLGKESGLISFREWAKLHYKQILDI